MPSIPIQAEIEDRFCRLLDEHGLPLPDRSLWGTADVSFVWEASRLVVIVRKDEFDEIDAIAQQVGQDLRPAAVPEARS